MVLQFTLHIAFLLRSSSIWPMIHGSAIHIAYRILAAFFIDMGAKTSIVENLVFIQPLIYLYYFFIFVQIIKIIANFNYNHSVY